MRTTVATLVLTVLVMGFAPAVLASGDSVPKPAPRIADGAWADVLKGGHPRLLGPKEHLAERKKAFPQYYTMMASSDFVKSNESILAAGIVNAVEGVSAERMKPFLEKAIADVRGGVTNEHQDTWIKLTEVAQAYDFFYDSIKPEDRKAMIDWMNAHLGTFTIDENAFHNSTLSKILCYLRIAYATWGENPRAKDFRDYALRTLYEGKIVPVLEEFGEGGGFTECGWYSRSSLWHLTEGLELARRFEGYDGFAKCPSFFYSRLAYEMFQPYPGLWLYGSQRYPCEGDGSIVYGGHNEYPRHMRTVLAQYFRGSELARATAAQARGASNSAAKIVDFLYLEEPDPAADLGTFPLAHLASGIGKVYARSDWTSDASWLRFECGDYWVGHQHFEAGNFEIFRYEPLATESGEYEDYGSNHAVNWLIRTIAHNSILVYEPGETWSQMRDGGKNKYANDGGQTKKWEWTVDNVDLWNAKRENFHRGDVVAYENRPEYMYVAGDCTKAYVPSKLESWVRQIVFVRPHTFVIFDRVVSTKAEYPKTWLLHCRLEPEIKGNTFLVKDGKGHLEVETLLPEKPKLTSIHGYTYGGQTFDEPENAQTPVSVRWRVEVEPPVEAKEDLFLHVLSTDAPVSAKLIREGGKVGADLGTAKVVFEGKTGGRLTIGGKEFTLATTVVKGQYE